MNAQTSSHGFSAVELAKILSKDLTAFVEDGRLFRVTPENDDDCRRDTVEECIGGHWGFVIIASLDWRAELTRTIADFKAAA